MGKAQHPSGDTGTPSHAGGVLDTQVSRRTVLKAAGLGAIRSRARGRPRRRRIAPQPAPAAQRTANQAKGEIIRLGALEGGLTDGFMPWKQFGQEFVWNWAAQMLLSFAPGRLDPLRHGHRPHGQRGRQDLHVHARGRRHVARRRAGDGGGRRVHVQHRRSRRRPAPTSPGASLPIVGAQAAFDDKTGATDATGIRVIDDHTIAFDLIEPNAQFLPMLVANTRIAPKHVYDGVAHRASTRTSRASTTMFIGSGPYKMTEFTPKESVNLEPHAGYVNGSGYSGAARGTRRVHPDLQRRGVADPVHAVGRGGLQLRAQAQRRQARAAVSRSRA